MMCDQKAKDYSCRTRNGGDVSLIDVPAQHTGVCLPTDRQTLFLHPTVPKRKASSSQHSLDSSRIIEIVNPSSPMKGEIERYFLMQLPSSCMNSDFDIQCATSTKWDIRPTADSTGYDPCHSCMSSAGWNRTEYVDLRRIPDAQSQSQQDRR